MKRMGVEETRVPPTSRLTALRAPAGAAVQDSVLCLLGEERGTRCRKRERLPILEMTHTAGETGRRQFEVFTEVLANISLKDNAQFPRLTSRDVFC